MPVTCGTRPASPRRRRLLAVIVASASVPSALGRGPASPVGRRRPASSRHDRLVGVARSRSRCWWCRRTAGRPRGSAGPRRRRTPPGPAGRSTARASPSPGSRRRRLVGRQPGQVHVVGHPAGGGQLRWTGPAPGWRPARTAPAPRPGPAGCRPASRRSRASMPSRCHSPSSSPRPAQRPGLGERQARHARRPGPVRADASAGLDAQQPGQRGDQPLDRGPVQLVGPAEASRNPGASVPLGRTKAVQSGRGRMSCDGPVLLR